MCTRYDFSLQPLQTAVRFVSCRLIRTAGTRPSLCSDNTLVLIHQVLNCPVLYSTAVVFTESTAVLSVPALEDRSVLRVPPNPLHPPTHLRERCCWLSWWSTLYHPAIELSQQLHRDRGEGEERLRREGERRWKRGERRRWKRREEEEEMKQGRKEVKEERAMRGHERDDRGEERRNQRGEKSLNTERRHHFLQMIHWFMSSTTSEPSARFVGSVSRDRKNKFQPRAEEKQLRN